MKPGMKIGHKETLRITVKEEMFAEFGGAIVHPAYSTAWMVYHMEWASRKIILPYLEEEEEGMGASVSVKHLAPGRLDDELIITATLISHTERSVVTEVKVHGPDGLIGMGEVKQAILPKLKIQSMLSS